MPCSLTATHYPATPDPSLFQECADSWLLRAVPSFLLFSFTRILFLFLILQTPSELGSNALLQKAFSEPLCLSLGFQSRKKQVQMTPEVNILPLCSLANAGSASLSNSPAEQADLVTDLCRFLLYKRPFPYRSVHRHVVV